MNTNKSATLSRSPFVHGLALFASPSLVAILLLVLIGPAFAATADSAGLALLGALLLVLAFGPVNFALAFVAWPLYDNLTTWWIIQILGWLASAFLFGAIFSLLVRALGRKWGYSIAVTLVCIPLPPLSYLTAAFIAFG